MVKTFYNYKVGTKILIGYVIALALMAIVIIVALIRINQINKTVIKLAQNLASEQHTADQVVASVWATHFYALQYMDQQNPADLERYNTEYAKFDQLLNISESNSSNQERIRYLEEIKSGVQTYGADFTLVTNLLETRERYLLIALDKQGRLAEIKLEQIRANSFFSNDTETSYQAGNAQRALLLMRVAAFQYLESGDAYWINEFDRWHTNFQTSFSKLDAAIKSPIYGTMAQDAQMAVDIYAQSFIEIQQNFSRQQEIVSDRLNIFGPMIRDVGAAISNDVATDFQTAATVTQTQAAQTQRVLIFTMGVAIITALGSGIFISRSITTPLKQVTGIARQVANLDLHQLTSEMDAVAQGDLTRHLTITTRALSIHSDDEIGQMARAFNAIIRQVRKAGSTFSEMASNLRTLTEHNAQLFKEAQGAQKRAEAASQAKSNFLANMSHELRTPLNAILGYTQLLRRDNHGAISSTEGLYVIEESGRHLLTLINDVLDFAKIETGKLWLQPKPVHLRTFLDGVVGMMNIRAKEKGLDFIDERDSTLPSGVEVDEKRLRQVLINLLSNAINFTPAGTVKLHVQCVSGQNGKRKIKESNQLNMCLRFVISDTGIGINSNSFDTIFQPFEQLSPWPDNVDGTGLGLSISQQIIQAMGSEILIDSEEGNGSTFWFDLILPAIENKSAGRYSPILDIVGYSGPERKILLVDDKPYNLSMLENFFKSLGFRVISAKSGVEALEKSAKNPPDLIIIDMLLFEIFDDDIVCRFEQCYPQHNIKIVGTSATLNLESKDSKKIDAFLPKPINFTLLLNLLENILQLSWLYETGFIDAETDKPFDYAKESQPIIAPEPPALHTFYDLAMKGNMPGILKKVAELENQDPAYNAFTRELKMLAKTYDEKSVLLFLSTYK